MVASELEQNLSVLLVGRDALGLARLLCRLRRKEWWEPGARGRPLDAAQLQLYKTKWAQNRPLGPDDAARWRHG